MKRPTLQLDQALGLGASDKRLDILRRIGEVGSISEAARGAQVSYKAAWQAVETLSNLAGLPLVERSVGGAGGGGAHLTEAGRQLLQAAVKLQSARAGVIAQFQAGDASTQPSPVLGALALRTSMRNQLPCLIRQLQRDANAVRVSLALNDGQTLASSITRGSAELLDLREGLPALVLFKATAVRVARSPEASAGMNCLQGRVSRAASSMHGGEVSLALPGGLQVVGMALAGHGLRTRSSAWACVHESAVVIALAA